MRTQVFKTLLIGLCLTLAGCQLGSGLVGRTDMVILDGAMQIAAPTGYCIEPQAGRVAATTTVVFLGRCSAQSKTAAAVVTISIGAPASGGVTTAGAAALADFFKSEPGRAALSRSGKAQDVRLITARGTASVLWLYLEDVDIGSYWRAITAVRGRLVTLSATGIVGHPLLPEAGLALLQSTYAALQKANR
jgi:hypothetical protein